MRITLVLFFCLTFQFISAQNKDDEIRGKTEIEGWGEAYDLSFKYTATVNYRFVLFGGVKFDLNVTDVSLTDIKYDGADIKDEVFDELGYKGKNAESFFKVEKGLYDVKTDIEFNNCFFNNDFVLNVNKCSTRVFDVDVLSVGYGTIDEYTYLENKKVKKIKAKFNITKPEDFYTLDAELINTELNNFTNLELLRKIKSKIGDLKEKEVLIAQKLKELRQYKANEQLTLEELKSKIKLIEELIGLDAIKCNKLPCAEEKKLAEDAMKERFGVKVMSEKEAIDYLETVIIKYQARWDIKNDLRVTACNITHSVSNSNGITYFDAPIYPDKILFDFEKYENKDYGFAEYRYSSKSLVKITATYNRVGKETDRLIYLSSIKEKEAKKVFEVLKRLGSFCKK